jgi:hypothetical protein
LVRRFLCFGRREEQGDFEVVVQRTIVVGAVIAACWPSARVDAQRSGSTNLEVHVAPEAHLDPRQVALRLVVSEDGSGDIASQTAVIATWARALPNQRIRLMGHMANLSGPDGAVPISAIRWSGSNVGATSGAQAASCAGGSFASGATQDLIAGWQRSGTLTCAVTFSLADPRSLPPGIYTGVVDFILHAE